MIRARLKEVGIDSVSKSGMYWDLIRNIPVRSIAAHRQQENLGLQNYCIVLASCN